MTLILFGFKSCGKTTYGKLLAKQLNLPFIDADDLICLLGGREGTCCRDIAQKKGEVFFRTLEREAIASLRPENQAIIAVGGGAVLDPQNLSHLKHLGKLVYLQASKELLKERLLKNELPSYLDPAAPLASFEKMYNERLPLYESIDAARIILEGKSEEEVVLELSLLEKNNG
jgi:shikimate kinase